MVSLWTALLLLAGLGLAGCSEDSEKPPEEFAPPTLLAITAVGAASVSLQWGGSSDEPLDNFEGYIVFWNPNSSIANLTPDLFPASVDSITVAKGTLAATVTGLAQGTKYFFHVRATKTNGDLSRGTNEVNAGPRPGGTGIIYEKAAAAGNPSAFDFSTGREISFVIEKRDSCDVYFGTALANDASADPYLKSPHIVVSPNDWSSRNTKIKDLGFTSDWDSFTTTSDTGWQDKAALSQNHVYVLKTPENNYVKLFVTQISGTYPNRTVTFDYAFQPIANYASFSPRRP
jgi:hypothetical protein